MLPVPKSTQYDVEQRHLLGGRSNSYGCDRYTYGSVKKESDCIIESFVGRDGYNEGSFISWGEIDNTNEKSGEELDSSRSIYDCDKENLAIKDVSETFGYTPPDGGWGWVVVVASFLCLCVLDGISYTFGMFLDPLMKDMDCGRGGTSAAGSFQVGVYSLTSLVSARLVTRYGARPVCIVGAIIAAVGLNVASYSWNMASLMVSYSFTTGVGFGLMYVPSVVAVAQQFTSKRALAIGICVCGSGMGTFILAPVEDFLLSEVGWRWTFTVLGCVCFLCTLCGVVMRPVKQLEVEQKISSSPQSCVSKFVSMVLSEELQSSPALSTFLLVCLADCVASMALYIPFTFLPDEATHSGVSLENASFLIAAMGICSSVGRVCSGLLCDRAWCNPLILTAVTVAAASIPPLLFPWISSYMFYLFLSCLFGFLTGIWIAATSPILVRILGLYLLSPAFGLMTAVQGAAALIGPPLAGVAVDLAGDRGVALQLSAGIMSSAALLYGFAFFSLRRLERK